MPTRTPQPALVNPHTPFRVSPAALLESLRNNYHLIFVMTRKEVIGRYRGSFMGLAWSFFHPVMMLLVYTFVFSVVFKARWGVAEDQPRETFALVLFSGLILHGLIAEALNRAPSLILNNTNYVKKVLFPLEILPVVTVLTSLFHALVSLTVLLIAMVVLGNKLYWTVVFAPLILLPYLTLITGLAWMLASLGVYLRDVDHTMGVITTALLFLAPILYPLSMVPEQLQGVIFLNPISFIVEQLRAAILLGTPPNWQGLAAYSFVAAILAWLGFAWFQKTRKGFPDVL